MADTAVASKKKSPAKAKKLRATPNHPKVSDMVVNAVGNLKERNGSSLQAIKKYIASKYKVDVEKIAPFIRKYLKTAVTSGALIQTKGKGASGSFKLGASKKMEKKPAPKPKGKAPGQAKEKQKTVVAKKKVSKPKAKKPKQKSKKVKKAKAPKPKKAVKASKTKSAPKQSAA